MSGRWWLLEVVLYQGDGVGDDVPTIRGSGCAKSRMPLRSCHVASPEIMGFKSVCVRLQDPAACDVDD